MICQKGERNMFKNKIAVTLAGKVRVNSVSTAE